MHIDSGCWEWPGWSSPYWPHSHQSRNAYSCPSICSTLQRKLAISSHPREMWWILLVMENPSIWVRGTISLRQVSLARSPSSRHIHVCTYYTSAYSCECASHKKTQLKMPFEPKWNHEYHHVSAVFEVLPIWKSVFSKYLLVRRNLIWFTLITKVLFEFVISGTVKLYALFILRV